MLIYVKKRYTIHGDFAKNDSNEKFNLSVIAKNNSNIKITIHPADQIIDACYQTDISENFYHFLKTNEYNGVKILDENLQKISNIDKKIEFALYEELSRMQSELTDISEQIFDYLKYFCNQKEVWALQPDDATSWSTDGRKWEITISETKRFLQDYWSTVYQIYPLWDQEIKKLQKCLDLKIEPFLAYDFLFKAENNENDSRYKWIFTTIALEYAIKEYLSKKAPLLELFLIDNQAPPIYKLYGTVLNQVEEEEVKLCLTPNEIRIASEMRNFLVHRPSKMTIDLDDARIYVQLASITINQLFSRLNPNSPYSADMQKQKTTMEFPKKKYERKLTKARKNS